MVLFEWVFLPSRSRQSAAPLGLLIVQSRSHSNEWCAVCADVVFVCAKLAALGSDSFELLLGWCVRVSNVHEEAFLTDTYTVVFPDDVVANISAFKARKWTETHDQRKNGRRRCVEHQTYRANPTPRLFPMLSRSILLDKIVQPMKIAPSSCRSR